MYCLVSAAKPLLQAACATPRISRRAYTGHEGLFNRLPHLVCLRSRVSYTYPRLLYMASGLLTQGSMGAAAATDRCPNVPNGSHQTTILVGGSA